LLSSKLKEALLNSFCSNIGSIDGNGEIETTLVFYDLEVFSLGKICNFFNKFPAAQPAIPLLFK